MEISEYNNIYKNESTHFFYIGTHLTVLELTKRYSSSKPSLYILDAGCGTGLLTKKLSMFGTVTGIDYNPQAIKLSQKRGLNAFLA
jgi:2-polyprenyl-3-methyl-5-hydroxy-6-metoxy-1,4-benzoquinol methylase